MEVATADLSLPFIRCSVFSELREVARDCAGLEPGYSAPRRMDKGKEEWGTPPPRSVIEKLKLDGETYRATQGTAYERGEVMAERLFFNTRRRAEGVAAPKKKKPSEKPYSEMTLGELLRPENAQKLKEDEAETKRQFSKINEELIRLASPVLEHLRGENDSEKGYLIWIAGRFGLRPPDYESWSLPEFWRYLRGVIAKEKSEKERKEKPPAAAAAPKKGDTMDHFEVPSGVKWDNVVIRFTDGHTVSVKAGDKNGVCNYTQMGMIDMRNSTPNASWELLKTIAGEHGSLTWDTPEAKREFKKQKERLAKALKKFFRIDEDPFKYLPTKKGWEALFAILPDE